LSQLQQETNALQQQLLNNISSLQNQFDETKTTLQNLSEQVDNMETQLQSGTSLSMIAYVAVGLAVIAIIVSFIQGRRRVKAPQ